MLNHSYLGKGSSRRPKKEQRLLSAFEGQLHVRRSCHNPKSFFGQTVPASTAVAGVGIPPAKPSTTTGPAHRGSSRNSSTDQRGHKVGVLIEFKSRRVVGLRNIVLCEPQILSSKGFEPYAVINACHRSCKRSPETSTVKRTGDRAFNTSLSKLDTNHSRPMGAGASTGSQIRASLHPTPKKGTRSLTYQ